MALIELVDVGVDRLDVLAQPLPLSLEASRGIERPDDQRPPLLEPPYDLDGDPVNGPLDATDHLGAVASNGDGLPEHRRRGHDDLGRSPHVKLDQLRVPCPWVESADGVETGVPPAELGAEVIVGASVGANEPAAASSGGGLFDWSRS